MIQREYNQRYDIFQYEKYILHIPVHLSDKNWNYFKFWHTVRFVSHRILKLSSWKNKKKYKIVVLIICTNNEYSMFWIYLQIIKIENDNIKIFLVIMIYKNYF